MGVYSEIKKLQKSAADDDYIVFYVYRKISVFFSVIAVKLRFSANLVTFISLLADFAAIYFMYLKMWVLAGIFVQLAIILDCSDGEVARYNISKGRKEKGKRYGGYLDEVLGTIGFTLVIFFAGYFMGSFWIGFFAMFGMFMILVSSATAALEFENKKQIARNLEARLFGKRKGRIGFTNAVQRIMISLALVFTSLDILLIFGVMAHSLYLLKFWLYRRL